MKASVKYRWLHDLQSSSSITVFECNSRTHFFLICSLLLSTFHWASPFARSSVDCPTLCFLCFLTIWPILTTSTAAVPSDFLLDAQISYQPRLTFFIWETCQNFLSWEGNFMRFLLTIFALGYIEIAQYWISFLFVLCSLFAYCRLFLQNMS